MQNQSLKMQRVWPRLYISILKAKVGFRLKKVTLPYSVYHWVLERTLKGNILKYVSFAQLGVESLRPFLGFLNKIIDIRMCVLSHSSRVWLFVTLWTIACRAPLSMGFSRHEYWSGLPWVPFNSQSWKRRLFPIWKSVSFL